MGNYVTLLLSGLKGENAVANRFVRMVKGWMPDCQIYNGGTVLRADFPTKNASRTVFLSDNSVSNRAVLYNRNARKLGLKEVETTNRLNGESTVDLLFDRDVSGVVSGLKATKTVDGDYNLVNLPISKSQELFRALRTQA